MTSIVNWNSLVAMVVGVGIWEIFLRSWIMKEKKKEKEFEWEYR